MPVSAPSAPRPGCMRALAVMMTTETGDSQRGLIPRFGWKNLLQRNKDVDLFAEYPHTPAIRCDRTNGQMAVIAGLFAKPPFPPVCVEDGNSRCRAPVLGRFLRF